MLPEPCWTCKNGSRCNSFFAPLFWYHPPGEELRWTAQNKEFDNQIQRLTGDCALASAFVSYLGPFNKEFRELLLNRDFYGECQKLGVPVTTNMAIAKFLVDEAEVGEWTLQGLPTDELSIQNGIMVTRASRYPVLVDPQVGWRGDSSASGGSLDVFVSVCMLGLLPFCS